MDMLHRFELLKSVFSKLSLLQLMGMGKVMKRIHLERNYGDADFFFKIEPVNPSNFDPK